MSAARGGVAGADARRSREHHRLRVGAALLGLLISACSASRNVDPAAAGTPGAGGAGVDSRRIETPVASASPDADVIEESLVRLYAPLPPSLGPHPEACDWISYLRFRHARGPQDATGADAVLVGMQGLNAGAALYDQLARHVVKMAAAQGKYLEFWALDRRANCLEDRSGIVAAAKAQDHHVAFDYYYGGKEIDGHKFAGFKPGSDYPFLADFGMRRTVEDEYEVMRREMPAQAMRQQKLFCGGHSLGGPITAAFASWDFDGDPATLDDAGFNQCAGYFALDTNILDAAGPVAEVTNAVLGPLLDVGYEAGTQIIRSSGNTYLTLPVNPELLTVIGIAGVSAFYHPGDESDLPSLIPATTTNELMLRLIFSRDALAFASGSPGIRDYRMTNAAVLGSIMDDNADPIMLIQASVGTYDGGPVQTKRFPFAGNSLIELLPDYGPRAAALLGGQLMIPSEPNGPLYGWRNYDHVGDADAPAQRNDAGQPFTTPQGEVTDLQQLARLLHEAPLDAWEAYFPTRLLFDVGYFEAGVRQGDLAGAMHAQGPTARPLIMLQGGEGFGTPDGVHLPNEHVFAGYNHVDVSTAAEVQNNGQPEPVSATLTQFILDTLKKSSP